MATSVSKLLIRLQKFSSKISRSIDATASFNEGGFFIQDLSGWDSAVVQFGTITDGPITFYTTNDDGARIIGQLLPAPEVIDQFLPVKGIDLSTKGGLVWIKSRTSASWNHILTDTANGAGYWKASNLTDAQAYDNRGITSFNTNGFSIGSWGPVNSLTGGVGDYVGWTFRKQPKFFDVVTYTGTGSNTTISHLLGSVPACIMVKRTDTTGDWQVYHRSLANTQYMVLNSTAAVATGATRWNSTTPTSTVFSVGTDATVNASGGTYVAYLFAHNAGGFGLTGTDNVISCGGVTANSSGDASINLGYEPQWLLTKRTDTTGNWELRDTMRGFGAFSGFVNGALLRPNTSGAEASPAGGFYLTATGFEIGNGMPPNATYIYIAIRRGPMKVPTDATKVFAPVAYTGNSSTQTITTNFPVDLMLSQNRVGGDSTFIDRLRGFGTASNATKYLFGDLTDAEGGVTNGVLGMTNTGLNLGSWAQTNFSSQGYASWNMRRAPSFFDEVCYTEQSALYTTNHNLAALPELLIYKVRSSARDWFVLYKNPSTGLYDKNLLLNTSDAATTWYEPVTAITSTTIPAYNFVGSGTTDVAYLFATCAGVSKVGSYTGNGSTQTINCGFTGGARFVLIKRTDATGDWYTYDTARGMTTLTDPYLRLNSTAAETATLGSVTTVSTGFAVNAAVLAAINTNAATYIFLAIA